MAYINVFDAVNGGGGARPATATATGSRPGCSRRSSATPPRTSPRRSPTRSATTSAWTTTATRAAGLRPRPRRLGADHGRRLRPPDQPVEQGRLRRRQQPAGRRRDHPGVAGRSRRRGPTGIVVGAPARPERDGVRHQPHRRRHLPARHLLRHRRASPRARSPSQANLDIKLTLLDAVGQVVATARPASAQTSASAASGMGASLTRDPRVRHLLRLGRRRRQRRVEHRLRRLRLPRRLHARRHRLRRPAAPNDADDLAARPSGEPSP